MTVSSSSAIKPSYSRAGVLGASPVARVPGINKIIFVGSSLTECILVQTFLHKVDQRKARERELATFDENR